MELTNEEMEVLNRATEILSKYVDHGVIPKELFESFDQMVVSAIDSEQIAEIIDRIELESPPYERLVFSHMVGYYDEQGKAQFSINDNIMDLEYKNGLLQFDAMSSDLTELFNTISDFTIAPVFLLIRNASNYVLMGSEEANTDNEGSDKHIKATAVNAPFLCTMPLVYECRMEKREEIKYYHHFSAKILNINAKEKGCTSNGSGFNIFKVWSKMSWERIGDSNSDSTDDKEDKRPEKNTEGEENMQNPKKTVSEDTLRKLIENYDDAELLMTVLKNHYAGQLVTEKFLIMVIDDFYDEELLKYILENHYSGQVVTIEFIQKIIDDFDDEELLKYVLANYYSGRVVPIEFIQKIVDDFNDEDLLKYVLMNHFSNRIVTESFLQGIVDDFGDADLIKYIMEHHYRGQTVSEEFVQDIIDNIDDENLLKYILKYHYNRR